MPVGDRNYQYSLAIPFRKKGSVLITINGRGAVGRLVAFVCSRMIPFLLTALALWGLYWISRALEPMAYDLMMRFTAQPAQNSPVVLLLIDEETVQRMENRFGPLFWREESYVEIFTALQAHNPAVMVFDTDTLKLNRLANKALQPFPALVSGWDIDALDKANPDTLPWLYTLKAGVVNSPYDEVDGVVRQHHRFLKTEQGMFPSLPVSTVIEYLRVKRGERQSRSRQGAHPVSPSSLGTPTHLVEDSQVWENSFPEGLLQRKDFTVRWYQSQPQPGAGKYAVSHPAVPLWKLFEPGGVPKDFFKGKIVILGNSLSLYRDHRKTPMSRHHLQADIHATAIDNILMSQTMARAPDWQQFLIVAGFCLFVCLLQLRVRNFVHTVLCTTSLMALYLYVAYSQFAHHGWVLDVVTPEVFMLVGLLIGSSLRIMGNDQQVKAMEYTLSQLVSQSVFQEIQRSGYTLQPGGQRMEITTLFVDIRNFSTLAENMPPGAVTDLLNEFYTVVEKITFHHRGTVDKFMGDGILILFGAPIASPDHADAAFAAAQDILEATETLARRWWETTGVTVEMGLSLNSGPAFVGFLGPIYKLEYTAIGDTVNLAVRLQNENKRFKTRIILSEFTVQRLSNRQQLMELDRVTVRGREGSVSVFTLSPKTQGAVQPPALGRTVLPVLPPAKATGTDPVPPTRPIL